MQAKTRLIQNKRGAASALIILLLVLLIFFGVLALVSGAANLRLARKRADWNSGYYLADSQAQQVLALISQVCVEPEFLDADPAAQVALLARELGNHEQISGETVTAVNGSFVIDALVFSPAGSDQGIEITVTVEPEKDQSLAINRWNWWREPFDYSSSFEGIWDGQSDE